MKKPVISILSALAGAAVGACIAGNRERKTTKAVWGYSDKHLELFKMMSQWVKAKQEGKNLSSYLERNGYKRIAIYGMSYAGETLVAELEGTGVTVAYGIDKRADLLYSNVDIVTMDDELAPVDVIVVTAITFFDEIYEQLSEKIDCPIISLEDVLYEV